MPFHGSPYATAGNPVFPYDQFEALNLGGPDPDRSPRPIIPSPHTSDPASDEWILGPWPSRPTSQASPRGPQADYLPQYPTGMPPETRPAHRRAQSSNARNQGYVYQGGDANPFNNPYPQPAPGTGWVGPQPLPGMPSNPMRSTPRVQPGYIPAYPQQSPYAQPAPLSPYVGQQQQYREQHHYQQQPSGMPAGMPMGFGGMPGGFSGGGGMMGMGAMGGFPPPATPRLGRPKEDEAAVAYNRWEENPEYGVVLDSLQFTVLKAKIAVNPLLMPPDVDNKKKSIVWNVLFPSNTAHLSSEHHTRSWIGGRGQPATFPRLSSIRLCSPCFPWVFEVTNPDGVTCGDVIDSLYAFMTKIVNKSEWAQMSRDQQSQVGAAYKWNRSTHRGAPGGLMGAPILRADLLRAYTIWNGLVADDKYIEDTHGSPPGPSLVVVLESRAPPPAQIAAAPANEA